MAPHHTPELALSGAPITPGFSKMLPRSASGVFTFNPTTATELGAQFRNPSNILSVLLVVGGDIVQRAMAQMSHTGLAPVCFSFGWVSYSLITLVNLLGDGRLMPILDYPCKVINLNNGYHRENKSWLIGRLMRENEAFMTRTLESKHEQSRAMRIAIYDPSSHVPKRIIQPIHLVVIVLQLAVAAIPLVLHGDWSSLLVTTVGTTMAIAMGMLPQWKAEKFPTVLKSDNTIAITAGNGSRDVIIVQGTTFGMDFEHLAAAEGPRGTRPWERWGIFKHKKNGSVCVQTSRGLPVDFWFTRITCTILALGWLALLILVAGIQSNTWYLLIIGCMGTFQNIFAASSSIHPEGLPLSLLFKEVIYGHEAMDALMDLQVKLENDDGWNRLSRSNLVRPLLKEFFPGQLAEDEVQWWKGERYDYDKKRKEQFKKRGNPRSYWDFGEVQQPSARLEFENEESNTPSQYPIADIDRTMTSAASEQAIEMIEGQHKRYEETDSHDEFYQNPPGFS